MVFTIPVFSFMQKSLAVHFEGTHMGIFNDFPYQLASRIRQLHVQVVRGAQLCYKRLLVRIPVRLATTEKLSSEWIRF